MLFLPESFEEKQQLRLLAEMYSVQSSNKRGGVNLGIIVGPFLDVLYAVTHLYTWAVIIYVILNWLLIFNIINAQNKFVSLVIETLFRITEPLLGAIRRILPNMGGLDLSPIVLILGLYFLESFIIRLAKHFQ